MNETKVLIEKITEGIQEKKGKNIVIADLPTIDATISQYFVICQGNSPRHVFLPEARNFYNLEHLWADAKLITIPDID